MISKQKEMRINLIDQECYKNFRVESKSFKNCIQFDRKTNYFHIGIMSKVKEPLFAQRMYFTLFNLVPFRLKTAKLRKLSHHLFEFSGNEIFLMLFLKKTANFTKQVQRIRIIQPNSHENFMVSDGKPRRDYNIFSSVAS